MKTSDYLKAGAKALSIAIFASVAVWAGLVMYPAWIWHFVNPGGCIGIRI